MKRKSQGRPPLPIFLCISIISAAVGGILFGANQGALDLHWSEMAYYWAQAPERQTLIGFLDWYSESLGGQLPNILLIGGSFAFWSFCLFKGYREQLTPAWHRYRKKAELIVLASLLIAILGPLLKGAVARERPRYHRENVDYTPWYDCVTRNRERPFKRGSFPSGHTLQASMVFGLVYWVGRNGVPIKSKAMLLKLGIAFMTFLYVAVMGFSRIVLAKHWLADVFFSCIIGYWIISFSAWVVFTKLDCQEPLFAFAGQWIRGKIRPNEEA